MIFVRILRAIADGQLEPEEAVRDYHGQLQEAGTAPHRKLDEDLKLTQLWRALSVGLRTDTINY